MPANKKGFDLPDLSSPATGDILIGVDVSDTTDSADGSTKKLTLATLASWLASLAQTLTNKILTSPVINTGVSGTAIDTDGTLAANSDTKLASQKAIKAYVDGKASVFVGAKGSRSTTQSIPDNTTTAIQLTSEDFDTDGFHDNAINNTRLTVPTGKDGYYQIIGQVAIAANATGRRLVVIRKNGATIGQSEWVANSASFAPYMQVSAVISLIATDYLELLVYQNSGGALNTDVGSVNSSLSCARLGV